MAIEQNLLPRTRCSRVALELGVNNRIMTRIGIQHFSLCSMLLKQSPQECSTSSTVLCVIWPGRNCFEGYKFLKRLNELILMNFRFVGFRISVTAIDVPHGYGVVVRSCDVELLITESGDCRR